MTPQQERIAAETPKPWWVRVLVPGLVILALALAGGGAWYARSGSDAAQEVRDQGKRRDCVTTVATARNAVFQNVALYTSLSTQLLNDALLRTVSGEPPLSPERRTALRKEYDDNNRALTAAAIEGFRVLPASFLDDVIARGGVVDGVHYDACPS